jgi:cell wall-associated NlpC family hydrolase
LWSCNSNKKATTNHNKENLHNIVQTKYAELLNVPPSEIQNIALYDFIDKWLGVKYKFGGTTQEGVDCSGFANTLYKEVYKTVLPRTSQDIAKQLKSTPKNNLSEGDILVFDIDGKKSSHIGIYLTNNKFVHSSTSRGVIISSLEHPYYQKAFSKAGQL